MSVHKARCDVCKKSIVGVRYKCANCRDYDLCEQCENLPNSHLGDHLFLKIKTPLPTYGYHPPLPILYNAIPPSNDQGSRGDAYRCENCRNVMTLSTCDVGSCSRCSGFMPSGSDTFCRSCSLQLELCYQCGGAIEQVSVENLDKQIAKLDADVVMYENMSPTLKGAFVKQNQREREELMKRKELKPKSREQLLAEALDSRKRQK